MPSVARAWLAAVMTLAMGSSAALAGEATPPSASDGAAPPARPAGTSLETTGSVETAAPDVAPATPQIELPLAAVGRGVREALAPPPSLETERAAEPDPKAWVKPPTPEEAAELSETRDRDAIRAFYEARHDAPVWVSKTGLEPRALSAIAEMARAEEWGMDPKAFEVPQLPAASASSVELSDAELAKAETTMAVAVLKYMRFARGGAIAQPDRQLSSFYDRRPQVVDRRTMLEEIATTDDAGAYLVSLQPKHPEFERLRQAWHEARRAKAGKLVKIPPGSALKPGERHPQVALLRKRMGLAPAQEADAELYDDTLARAVKGFQAFRSLAPADGTLDDATRAALAKPLKANADQLLANMQAWRYIPGDMGSFHVWLNIPEYLIRIVKDGRVIWTERVTTGLVNKQTPVFSDKMELVTFKSKWRVPDSIKVREVWPSLLRGGGMMRQYGLTMENRNGEAVDWRKIDWSKVSMEDYTLWQPPGPRNQLGIVKFSLPSKHYVFMHDTPDKHMFNWSRRAVSHGCMRIRKPLEMATIILEADKGWDRARIDELVKNGPDHNVIELDKDIPVHITYFTARVEEDGKITTWSDIYGHEKRVTLALQGKWDKITVPPNHLAPLDQSTVPAVAQGPARKKQQKDESVLGLISQALGGI